MTFVHKINLVFISLKRSSNYLPHTKKRKSKRQGPLPRRGRIVWDDDDSNGAAPAPRGTFPWMVK